MRLTPGTRLGPYEILAAIGAGGMGEVYQARDTRLDRSVAIKVLPPVFSADPDRRSRFEREAKTIAGLNHPHICSQHDVGEASALAPRADAGQARLSKGRTVAQQRRSSVGRVARIVAVAWLIVGGVPASGPASAQETEVPFTWTSVNRARFTTRDGLLRVSASKGWLATGTDYVDFVVRLDFRAAEPGSEGNVLVRAWDGLWETSGYWITLSDPATGELSIGTVGRRGGKKPLATPDKARLATAAGTAAGWHHVEIRCEGNRVSVALDGAVVNAVEGSEPLAGYIGLVVSRGAIELRDVYLAQLPGGVFACWEQPAGVLDNEAAGLSHPVLLAEEKPRYTSAAMRRKVQGVVAVNAVVGLDGRVESACVARSLDRDLDAQAVGAARRWRFVPGQAGGKPVRTLVSIEMAFTLK